MKCRLVQILAVAMLLGHTVSIYAANAWTIPLEKLRVELASSATKVTDSAAKTDEPVVLNDARLVESAVGESTVSGVARLVESAAESGELQLANTLPGEVNAVIQKVTAYDFTKFNIANEEEAYGMVNKLLDIKKHVYDSTHADRTKLLENINIEIDNIKEKLNKIMNSHKYSLNGNMLYYMQILEKIDNVHYEKLFRDEDIQ